MAFCLHQTVGSRVRSEIKGERCVPLPHSNRELQLYLTHLRQPGQQEALAHRAVLMSRQIKQAKSEVTINISAINSYYHWPFDVSVCLKPQVILFLAAGALFILG